MATDSLDGYLARKYHKTSQFGAFLDPLMDKFFVFFAVSITRKESEREGQGRLTIARCRHR